MKIEKSIRTEYKLKINPWVLNISLKTGHHTQNFWKNISGPECRNSCVWLPRIKAQRTFKSRELTLVICLPVAQLVKILPAMWETWVQSVGWEDRLEKGTATHSSILAWRIPWTEEPGRLQSMGLQSQTRLSDFHFSLYLKAGPGWLIHLI